MAIQSTERLISTTGYQYTYAPEAAWDDGSDLLPNAGLQDGVFASAFVDYPTKYQTQFLQGFFDLSAISDAAIIRGMEIGIKLYSSPTSSYITNILYYIPGKDIGEVLMNGGTPYLVPSWKYYGDSLAMWGFTSLTGADLKIAGGGPGFTLQAAVPGHEGESFTGYVDCFSLRIWYELEEEIPDVPITIDTALSTEWVKLKHRITRKSVEWPIGSPPYTNASGFAEIGLEEEVTIVSDYSISMSDGYAADKLTMNCVLGANGKWNDFFDYNDIITIEELYRNSLGDVEWIPRGTFLLDSKDLSVAPGEGKHNITALSTMKLLTVSPYEGRLWADKLFVERIPLTCIDSPNITPGLQYYKFVHGTSGSHTYSWAIQPVPKLWLPNGSSNRCRFRDGSVDLLYGTGEVYIEKEYFESDKDDGGLGNPENDSTHLPEIDCQYYRLALSDDVVGTDGYNPLLGLSGASGAKITGITQNIDESWTLDIRDGDDNVITLYSTWIGCTTTLISGDAKYKQYVITDVSGNTISISKEYNLVSDGVQVGDYIQIVNANRVETILQRLFLIAGFQDVDEDLPFYIEKIEPLRYDLYVPTSSDFDFIYDDNITPQEIIERIRKYIPPNYTIYTNVYGNAVCEYITQLEPNDTGILPIEMITQAGLTRNEDSIYTKVRYATRNRDYKNIASLANGELEYVKLPVATEDGGDSVENELWEYNDSMDTRFNDHYDSGTPKTAGRKIVDSNTNTGIFWHDSDTGQRDYSNLWNGCIMCELKFKTSHVIKEIHVVPFKHDNMVLDIWYSIDRIKWESISDEFTFQGRQPTIISDNMPKTEVQYLRIINAIGEGWNREHFGFGGFVSEDRLYTGISEIAVYADDIDEQYAELGVDRFNIVSWVKNKTANTLTLNVAAESHWEDKIAFVYTGSGLLSLPISSVTPGSTIITVTGDTTSVAINDMVVIQEGETTAEFNMDIQRRTRMGLKLFNVPGVDEYGYFVAQRLGITVSEYGKLQALAWLAEQQTEFIPVSLTAVRPDVTPRKTILATIPRLGISSTNMLVTEVNSSSNGIVNIKAVPYAGMNWAIE